MIKKGIVPFGVVKGQPTPPAELPVPKIPLPEANRTYKTEQIPVKVELPAPVKNRLASPGKRGVS